MTHPSWVALCSVAHNFIELHKPLCHDTAVIHEGDYVVYLKILYINSTSIFTNQKPVKEEVTSRKTAGKQNTLKIET